MKTQYLRNLASRGFVNGAFFSQSLSVDIAHLLWEKFGKSLLRKCSVPSKSNLMKSRKMRISSAVDSEMIGF